MTDITRYLGVGALAVLITASLPAAAAAQTPTPGGFSLSVGAGVGSADASCDDCNDGDDDDRQIGAAGYIRAGWALNSQVVIGAEGSLWRKKEDQDGADVTLRMYNLLGTLTFYPSATSGLWVKGGAGLSFADSKFDDGDVELETDTGSGLGVNAGVGYDFRVSDRVLLTPAIDYYYGNIGELTFDDEPFATDWKQNVLMFTIGLTFR
jgi:opacity protein-like surface antigen